VIISHPLFHVSFFGGGADYPSWYRAHRGAVLATTIEEIHAEWAMPGRSRGLPRER